MSDDAAGKKEVCKLAKVSVWCCVVAMFLFIVLLIFSPYVGGPIYPKSLLIPFLGFSTLSVVTGVKALVKISESEGRSTGKGRTFASLIGVLIMLFVIVMLPHLGGPTKLPNRLICGRNLNDLGTTFLLYNRHNYGYMPDGDKWCDSLVLQADVGFGGFVCPDSDAIEGECSYALNAGVAGKKMAELPGDMVVMFETNYGVSEQGRQGLVASRTYFKERNIGWGEDKVYEKRWNQVGGQELLDQGNHEDYKYGCHVLFADYSVRFVEAEDIAELRWTVNEKKKSD